MDLRPKAEPEKASSPNTIQKVATSEQEVQTDGSVAVAFDLKVAGEKDRENQQLQAKITELENFRSSKKSKMPQ